MVLRFTRVVFGSSSSRFLQNATIKHHIEKYKEADPEFEEKFLGSIYVDVLNSGASEVNVAYELYLKSKLRLAEGGFNLRNLIPIHLVLNLGMHSHPKLFWKGMLRQKRTRLMLRAFLVE